MRLRTALLAICSATALAVVPAAAGDEPATLETLPASQADDRLADLGVPAGDIAEAVEVLDEARSFTATAVVFDLGPSGWVNRASSWANKRAGDAQLGTPGPASNWGSASKLCLQANAQAASMVGWDNAADLVRLSTSSATC